MKVVAIKNNQNLTLILGTKHYQFSGDKADRVFERAQEYKKDPTEENLKELRESISKVNMIEHAGLIEEAPDGTYNLKGHRDIKMPKSLASRILEYVEKGYPVESFINFWKLCMANPNKQAREDFFGYVERFGIAITEKGYAILYKSVSRKEEADSELVNFISKEYIKIKKWKKSPKNYEVVDNGEEAEERYTLNDLYKNDSVTNIGILQDLHDNLDDLIEQTDSYYVPHYTGGDYGNRIRIGEPVTMPREKCDPDISIDCSYGLHVGAREYVKTFGRGSKLVLAVLVNPMNIVALPRYDTSKIRVCEYYPYGVMAIDREEWEEIEGGFFEEDYCDYEKEHIDEMIANNLANEVGEEVVEEEQRQRLIDIYYKEQQLEDANLE